MMLPPPTPVGGQDNEGEENEVRPPSVAGTQFSSPVSGGRLGGGGAGRAPFFGGRQSIRLLEGGCLRGLGGGGGEGYVGNVAAESQLLEGEQEIEEDKEQQSKKADQDASSAVDEKEEGGAAAAADSVAPTSAWAITLPALPEEPTLAAAPAEFEAEGEWQANTANIKTEERQEEECDADEVEAVVIKSPAWVGLAMAGVAIGVGAAVAMLLQSAYSLAFLR